MQSKKPVSISPTRQRLLDAAAKVFAREGLAGATTRAIANEAGVNEVTLFRHFQSKDRLLAAVVGENFGVAQPASSAVLPSPTGDLKADLLALAKCYDRLMTENLPLVRTMLGEIQHHHRNHEKQVFRGIFRPLKDAIIARLESEMKQRGGALAHSPVLLADLFTSMLFTGVLRRASKDLKFEYSPADYHAAVVELTLQGAVPARKNSRV